MLPSQDLSAEEIMPAGCGQKNPATLEAFKGSSNPHPPTALELLLLDFLSQRNANLES